MYLNVELELAIVAIQKCLVPLHDYLGLNTKKLWLQTHTQILNNKGCLRHVFVTFDNEYFVLGIGLGVVRGLCKKYDGTVYLTSR